MDKAKCNLFDEAKSQCKYPCNADKKINTCCFLCEIKKKCPKICQVARPIPREKKPKGDEQSGS